MHYHDTKMSLHPNRWHSVEDMGILCEVEGRSGVDVVHREDDRIVVAAVVATTGVATDTAAAAVCCWSR